MNRSAALARQALAKGDTAEALRIAKADADARPRDVEAVRLYATLSSEIGVEGAEDAWQKLLALRPDDPEAHYMLGNLAGEHGEFIAAADHFRAALIRTPNPA